MKVKILLAISCAFFFSTSLIFSQSIEKYSRVKIFANPTQVKSLQQKGITIDELAENTSTFITGVFSSSEISTMKSMGLKTQILVADLAADFILRNAADQQNQPQLRAGGTPPGFNYGSMGGYLTYDEMVAELDQLKSMYPNLITTKASIGTSIDGRNLWMVKISDNPDVEDAFEPGVVYTGLTHAREPLSMVNLIYFMQYILSQYGTDPEITCLINNRELYFVPCVNPDGYVYNQTTYPNGGGYWRKNRRANAGGSYGIDLNRNFSYQWGYDDIGSSPTPSSEVYRGTGPASEPEIAALQNFVSGLQVSTGLSYHTYSDKLLLPFAYNDSPPLANTKYNNVASLLTHENQWQYGRVMQILGYSVNGGSMDWMYGEKGIISFDPELGPAEQDFWPVQSQIIPIAESVLDMNISIAWAAGNYIKPVTPNNSYVSGLTYNLPITITNYGDLLGTLETVTLSMNDPRVLSFDGLPILLTGLLPNTSINIGKLITFVPGAANGVVNGNLIVTNLEGCSYSVPFSFNYSQNGCFSIPSSWTATDIGSPGLAGSSCYQNGIYTLKGSGTGGLQTTSDKMHMMKLTSNADVTDIRVRVTSAQNTGSNARVGISLAESTAPGAKKVSVLINPSNNSIQFQRRTSTNGSVTTTTVNNQGAVPKYLRISEGSGSNYFGYYSSNGISWTQIGKQKITFPATVTAGLVVTSGSAITLNTSTFDNLAVTTPGGVINRNMPEEFEEVEITENEFSVYPNPTSGMINVTIPVSANTQTLRILDVTGKMVIQKTSVKRVQSFDVSALPNGLYFLQLTEGTKSTYRKFIINK
jgi:hypothetical protein